MSPGFISEELRERVRRSARNRCGYCLSGQEHVWGKLEIEHIVPKALGGLTEESNLWLSCGMCNRYKGAQVQGIDPESKEIVGLFNPRAEKWAEHFGWNPAGVQIVALSAKGRVTIAALKLNNELALMVRRNWVQAGWHPPAENANS